MQEEKILEENKKNTSKEDFNIIVTYAKEGKSFQSIAENIIMRKIEEV